jgi:hypothetical protein
MKVFRINDGGFVWEFPAEAVAKNRATYYAEHDKDTTYDEEFRFTMGDEYELRDWFFNNMNWEDVESEARLVETPTGRKKPRMNHDDLEVEIVECSPQDTIGASND